MPLLPGRKGLTQPKPTYSPIAPALGLTGLPVTILIVLTGMNLGYVAANEGMKAFRRRAGDVALG